MAAPVPATGVAGTATFAVSVSVSITPSGSDRVMTGGAIWRNSTVVPTVTFNTSETLTAMNSGTAATGSGFNGLLWYRYAPTATTANCVFNWGGSEEAQGAVWATNWTGAHQTDPPTGFVSAAGSTVTPTVNVSSVPTDAATFDTMGTFAGSVSSLGAGQSGIISAAQSMGGGGVMHASYDGTNTGTVTQSYTISLDDWFIVAAYLKAAAGGGGGGSPGPALQQVMTPLRW